MHKKPRDCSITRHTPSAPTDDIRARTIQGQEVEFHGHRLLNPDVAPAPWHYLGTEFENLATAGEAIEAAGLNYTVVKKPLKEVVEEMFWTSLETAMNRFRGEIFRSWTAASENHHTQQPNKEDSMRHLNMATLAGSILFAAVIAGCASSPAVNKEPSTSAIRAAEELGASGVPSASLYLQLAKEELENAKGLAAKGDKEQAESLLLRAQADAELAIALSRGDSDKKEATQAIERVRQLRQDNQLPQGRK